MSEHRIKSSGKRMEMAPGSIVDIEAAFPVPSVEPVEAVVVSSEETGAFLASLVDSGDRPWLLMDDAPDDGTMIEVKEDPDQPDITAVMVRWYRTSVRDRALRKWVPAAWWRIAVTGERLGFEPFCWRVVAGFEMPGMIVA